MHMPRGMNTYRAPVLPEPELLQDLTIARVTLRTLQGALAAAQRGERPAPIELTNVPAADRRLLDSVLGEGEVSAVLEGPTRLHVQEAIFAGVWRVIETAADGCMSDRLEVGPLPAAILERATRDGQLCGATAPAAPTLEGLMNAPAILSELQHYWRADTRADSFAPAYIVNLTLLPLSAADELWLDAVLGRGSVTLLSRGYGNCRIASTARPHTWRVVYYNSQDHVILSTIEVSIVPEVACAAMQDLADSEARVAEVLAWIEGA
jgi:hydrogenase-1 operon protein HyaF